MMQRVGSALWPSLQAFQVYGANTNVGKTVVSTILCKALKEKEERNVLYLKPVSAGPDNEADHKHISKFVHGVNSKTLFQFSHPVPEDSKILRSTFDTLIAAAGQGDGDGVAILETAGGVLSPAPSGASQADLYRPLRLPVLYVGDRHLGGIACTISAYESLRIRGYDVLLHLIFQEDEYQNAAYLGDYFADREIPTLALPRPPRPLEDVEADVEAMRAYYREVASADAVHKALASLRGRHEERIARLDEMAAKARQNIWHPFTQHQGRSDKDVMVIDSAHGDFFATRSSDAKQILQPTYDGSASWWTQGLGHGNPELALSAAYAAGRYGHVMFAGAVHEPALKLTELLLKHHKNPRLAKVFFTESGSTGMEVGVKMALRAAASRYGWDHSKDQIDVLGLKGSYHGDTMGAMDCSEPSTYNEKVEWYKPKGYWFDYPKIQMKKGKWNIQVPGELEQHGLGSSQTFDSLDDIFAIHARDGSKYRTYIESTLESLRASGRKFGALVMEPVMLGAGGMVFVDPLFQHTLISAIREKPHLISDKAPPPPENAASYSTKPWSGLPVLFDEVLTGIYRLGRFNCSSFLQAHPDIVVNAKLLTGGIVPLCTTAAGQEIFDAFLSDDKTDALLHGHSYTAHPIGCNLSVDALKLVTSKEASGEWLGQFGEGWKGSSSSRDGDHPSWSMWSKDFVTRVSHTDGVEGVVALGSILGITLEDAAGGGYTSTAAQALQKALLEAGSNGWAIHSRVLGNVIYFMASLTVRKETVAGIQDVILEKLERHPGV